MCGFSEKQILTTIDLSKSEIYRSLKNDMFTIHGIIYSSFSTKEVRKLFQCGSTQICILSDEVPNKEHLAKEFGISLSNIKTYDYGKKLNKFISGKSYQFSLICNPVVTRLGKRIPLKTVEERGVWLATRCKTLGFVIKEFWKVKGHPVKGKNCTLNGVVYQGLLEITDKEQFRKTILLGIGHEKAYGFGLLWLEEFK